MKGMAEPSWRSIIGLCKAECLRPGPLLTGPLKTLADVGFATLA